MKNRLQYETSPYLLQHSENPVDWYPWGEEAFERARAEDKPVFLSIGYSTCHWCHIMARESFENPEIAALLNKYFISVKVDKEERPDIDSIYMAVCQAFTGSGGWPTTVFMTSEQKPFFAGTYFPPESGGNMLGLRELLEIIHDKWEHSRAELLSAAGDISTRLGEETGKDGAAEAGGELIGFAVDIYKKLYDRQNGGFGRAPKFPSPHNILFLLAYYERSGDTECLGMAEHTLTQMYRGGMFDHIGFGFCRYSTDARFLVPHFEKMLYDNALLILAYCKAYTLTKKELYRGVAEKTADFALRELKAPEGGFFSARDADSDGEEGKYYLFTREELMRLLGKDEGEEFCSYFGIDDKGNFEGKSIPNLLSGDIGENRFEKARERVYEYRLRRCELRTDKKILTAWNSLMIAALCAVYKITGKAAYLDAAKSADGFIMENLYKDGALFVSFCGGRRGARGFIDDYAAYIFARLALYGVSFDEEYLSSAERLCKTAVSRFYDAEHGGFYLYGEDNETLIFRPKETYDGAIPSGNSMMAWNLVRLSRLLSDEYYETVAKRQLDFISAAAENWPVGYAMFLLALLDYSQPRDKVTVVLSKSDDESALSSIPSGTLIRLLREPEGEYRLKDGKTTYYICRGHSCLPPTNHFE